MSEIRKIYNAAKEIGGITVDLFAADNFEKLLDELDAKDKQIAEHKGDYERVDGILRDIGLYLDGKIGKSFTTLERVKLLGEKKDKQLAAGVEIVEDNMMTCMICAQQMWAGEPHTPDCKLAAWLKEVKHV